MLHDNNRPSIFIGSSIESKEGGYLFHIENSLREHFVIEPWTRPGAGNMLLDRLIDFTEKIDFAVFLITRDYERTFRNNHEFACNDNVLFECGLFMSRLGKNRVRLLWERGVAKPSDLGGLIVNEFSFLEEPGRQFEELDLALNEIVMSWRKVTNTNGFYGLGKSLYSLRNRVDGMHKKLWDSAIQSEKMESETLDINVGQLSDSFYIEGLKQVSKRFFTTTFLRSPFWNQKPDDSKILTANLDMLNRFKTTGGESRRLLLLDNEMDFNIELILDKFQRFRRQGREIELQKIKSSFNYLKQNWRKLADENCELRFTYDDSRYTFLPKNLDFSPHETEIALYDDFRVDLFYGGDTFEITRLKTITKANTNFNAVYRDVKSYFDDLWAQSKPIEDLIKDLEYQLDLIERRIDYKSQWLAFFEGDFDKEDRNTKAEEFEVVQNFLSERQQQGNQLQHHLDVGTCTGRYIMGLRHFINDDNNSLILGIDVDIDCVNFATQNVKVKTESDPRIHVQQSDFLVSDNPKYDTIGPRKFDLATCMLGTISHFGTDRNKQNDDNLQKAIQRFYDVLNPNGLLIISSWNDVACSSAYTGMLSTYEVRDYKKLKLNTPNDLNLRNRLEQNNFTIVNIAKLTRLNVFFCIKNQTHGTTDQRPG